MIELDVSWTQRGVVGILMEPDHEVSRRVDPVDAVVFVFDACGFQPRVLNLVKPIQERRRIDIRDQVPGAAMRRSISNVLTAGLVRQTVVNISVDPPLSVAITTSEEDHGT